jgi:hypothetical protein
MTIPCEVEREVDGVNGRCWCFDVEDGIASRNGNGHGDILAVASRGYASQGGQDSCASLHLGCKAVDRTMYSFTEQVTLFESSALSKQHKSDASMRAKPRSAADDTPD